MILKKGSLKKLPALLKVTFFNTLHTLPITVACMAVATLTANAIFHLSGNAINVSIIYILAILLHARYTKCYSAGIIASLYSVFWVNYAYTYPYMTLNFTLSGYPLTFVGMTFISCFTSSICIMLSKQSVQIQEKDRMLMQAEKETMRANLLRAMSHDLRTPLTTIIGSSAAYLEQENEMSPEEKRKLIHNIEEDAQWLLNMVENLLSVTRIQDDKGITSVTKTDESLEEVISEAVRRFHKRFPGVTVQVHIPESFIMVPMDAMLIEQVIINLLENAYYIITPGGEVALEKISDFTELISSLGAIPLVITAEEHDFITAGVSHLPHIVASALVNLVNLLDNDAQYMKMIAAGGFRDITRIASSSPVMWEQICLENQKNISTVLDEFIRMLIQIRCSIDNKEADNIFDMFASSKDYRDSIDIVDNSLIPRSYVLYIDVADEAGAIATIATILATEKVSIKNIGIIHNREFEDGVLKIEFYTDAALEQAKVLLTKRNYKICER